MGLISSDGCTDNDLAIGYPAVGAKEGSDNYPRFLVQWQAMRLVSTPCSSALVCLRNSVFIQSPLCMGKRKRVDGFLLLLI